MTDPHPLANVDRQDTADAPDEMTAPEAASWLSNPTEQKHQRTPAQLLLALGQRMQAEDELRFAAADKELKEKA